VPRVLSRGAGLRPKFTPKLYLEPHGAVAGWAANHRPIIWGVRHSSPGWQPARLTSFSVKRRLIPGPTAVWKANRIVMVSVAQSCIKSVAAGVTSQRWVMPYQWPTISLRMVRRKAWLAQVTVCVTRTAVGFDDVYKIIG
jgi:hypothetical protein